MTEAQQHLGNAVSDLEARARLLLLLIDRSACDWTLSDLRALDRATRDLRTVRDTALDHLRTQGRSWSEIGAATHVAPTTWRGRLDRYRRESHRP